jgi:membrane protein
MTASPILASPSSFHPSFFHLLKRSYTGWSDHHASRLAAAVAYYATFSIAPLLLIAIALLGLIYGKDAAADKLRPELATLLGDKTAAFIQDFVAHAGYSPSLSTAGIISILLIIYASTNLFIALQDALNTIFGVQPKPDRGIKGIIADRALSFLMVLLLGLLVLASVTLSTVLNALSQSMPAQPFASTYLIAIAALLGSILLFTAVFAAVFKLLPDVQLAWKDTLLGAFLTSLVFSIARIALGIYLGRSSTTGPFGAAGSFVVVMLFIYYTTQILFFGAEFTQVWASRNGRIIAPSQNAARIDHITTIDRQHTTSADAARTTP